MSDSQTFLPGTGWITNDPIIDPPKDPDTVYRARHPEGFRKAREALHAARAAAQQARKEQVDNPWQVTGSEGSKGSR